VSGFSCQASEKALVLEFDLNMPDLGVVAVTAATTDLQEIGQQPQRPCLARSGGQIGSMGLLAQAVWLPSPPANSSPLKLTMSELVPSEIIEKLEARHERLIAELDELNERLEKALNSFLKPTEEDSKEENDKIRMTNAEKMTKSEA